MLVLSARTGVATKVEALDAGASDYLAKPFALDELLARVRVLLRAGAGPARQGSSGAARCWRWTAALARSRARDGRVVHLSEREYALLEYLVRSRDEVVSRERILNAVWDYQFDPRSNVVDVYVARLRRKLESEAVIETVRGGGYRLVPC